MTGKVSRIAAILVACVLLFNCLASGQKVADSRVANQFETYLKPFADTGNFTGAVLIARKGRVLFRHPVGMPK